MKTSDLISLVPSLTHIGEKSSLDLIIEGVSELDRPAANSLYFAKNKKLLSKWLEIEAAIRSSSLLVVDAALVSEASTLGAGAICSSQDVMISLCQSSKVFADIQTEMDNDIVDGRQLGTTKIDPTADISQHVFIGANVVIGPSVTIYPGSRILSHSVIEEGATIYPNVTIYPRTRIGARSVIHANTVIGADGFGYHFAGGVHHKIYHIGSVDVGRDVEIGANSCVDRATFGVTVVGDGSKLDNHVQVGHNCRLGRGVVLCGHVAIGGSTVIGDFTFMGGKSATGHGITLGSGVQVGGGGLVNCDWPDGSMVTGYPARELKEWLRGLAYVRKESLKKK